MYNTEKVNLTRNTMANDLKKNNTEIGDKLPELLTEVNRLIEELYPNSMVVLFGSYARGDAQEESDLDICILVPELTERRIDMNVEMRGLIRKALYAVLGTNHAFDTKLYTYNEFDEGVKLKSTLRYVIQEEGVILNE